MLVLTVCALKGGVGKTSVVLGLASAALARGTSCLVVDLDPQANATSGLDAAGGGEPAVDVADVLETPKRRVLRAAVRPSGWLGGEGPPGRLDVLVGGERTARYDLPEPESRSLRVLAGALAKVEGYDLALVDTPPSLGALTRSALVASGRAVVVTEPALFAVQGADRALRAVDEERRRHAGDLQPLGVVVNRYRDRSPEHRYRLEELRALFGPLVLGPPLAERSALQQAQGAAVPLHRWSSSSARELSATFDAYLARALRASRRRLGR